MKKTIAVILMLAALTTMFVSCASTGKSSIDCSAEVVSLMQEMVESEKYSGFYNLPAAYDEILKKLKSGSYSKPSAIYKLSIPEEALMKEPFDVEDRYEELDRYVESSLYASFASRINQTTGGDALAVSSAFCAQKSFVCKEIKESTVYLYVYENGHPIAITLIPGESDSIRVIGNFIINDNFHTDDAEKIENSCAEIGINGVVAKKQLP